MRIDLRANRGIVIGFFIHDMAPVAPHRLQIQDDEPMLRSRLRKGVAVRAQPLDRAGFLWRWRRERGKQPYQR